MSAKRPNTSVESDALEQENGDPDSAGQSGDTQGLSNEAGADSQSIRELVEEGQSLEAEVIDGIENAPDADESEVTTKEVPEDDVPQEYLDRD